MSKPRPDQPGARFGQNGYPEPGTTLPQTNLGMLKNPSGTYPSAFFDGGMAQIGKIPRSSTRYVLVLKFSNTL